MSSYLYEVLAYDPSVIGAAVLVIVLIVTSVLRKRRLKREKESLECEYQRLSALSTYHEEDTEARTDRILKGIELAKSYMDVYDYGTKGEIFRKLDPGDENCSKALGVIRDGLEINNIEAKRLMGDIYLRGVHYGSENVEKDYIKSREYYQEAADDNDVFGMYGLGIIYYKGYGVKRDRKQGKFWMQKSMQSGCPLAKAWLDNQKLKVILLISLVIAILAGAILNYYMYTYGPQGMLLRKV